MEEQVLTVEQMIHLKELGLDIDSEAASIYWLKNIEPDMGWSLMLSKPAKGLTYIPAYTLHDILEKLPYDLIDKKIGHTDHLTIIKCCTGYGYTISYANIKYIHSNSFLEAAYNMLCWYLAKNNE